MNFLLGLWRAADASAVASEPETDHETEAWIGVDAQGQDYEIVEDENEAQPAAQQRMQENAFIEAPLIRLGDPRRAAPNPMPNAAALPAPPRNPAVFAQAAEPGPIPARSAYRTMKPASPPSPGCPSPRRPARGTRPCR